jgi:predicted amidophosphoribosyltransferase
MLCQFDPGQEHLQWHLVAREYKPMCSQCKKELKFKGAIFYKGKVYCMDCRRKLKKEKVN